MFIQAVGAGSMSHTLRAHTHREKAKSKSMLTILFDIKGIVHNEFVLADKTFNSAYYCDILRQLHEIVRRLRPELWQQNNRLLHHDNAPFHISFFIREFFLYNMTLVPNPTYFSLTERPTILTQLR
jgi:hypothetical protein